jgi:hypothetical protein
MLTNNILVGLDDHALLMSCKVIGGKPSHNVLIKGNNKITELRTILQRESPNS